MKRVAAGSKRSGISKSIAGGEMAALLSLTYMKN
jgi:hypothetical protein